MKHLYIYISLISYSLFSQSVVLELDTNTLRIGERFNAIIKFYGLSQDSIPWEKVDSIFNDFELLHKTKTGLYLEGDTYIYKQFLLTNFDTGKFEISKQPILTINSDTLFTNGVTINYLPMPLDTTNRFFDIKPPKEIPFLIKELLYYTPYLLLFVCFIVLCMLIYYYRNQNKVIKPISAITKPIDIYFLEKLDILEKKKYLENKQYKSFYTDLSEIFRGYLEMRFDILALESDTSDLKLLLSDINIQEEWFNKFLRNCDIVKFAKGVPSNQESSLFLNAVRDFINKYTVKKDKHKKDTNSHIT